VAFRGGAWGVGCPRSFQREFREREKIRAGVHKIAV
jgi:hypothetical protein